MVSRHVHDAYSPYTIAIKMQSILHFCNHSELLATYKIEIFDRVWPSVTLSLKCRKIAPQFFVPARHAFRRIVFLCV